MGRCPNQTEEWQAILSPVNYVDKGEFDEESDENKQEEFIFAKVGGFHIKVR